MYAGDRDCASGAPSPAGQRFNLSRMYLLFPSFFLVVVNREPLCSAVPLKVVTVVSWLYILHTYAYIGDILVLLNYFVQSANILWEEAF